MGCTSSAPSSIASPTSATEKNLKFSGNMKEHSIPERMNTNMKNEDINVLPSPSCDKENLDDCEQLVKNNNSIVDISKMDSKQTGSELSEHEIPPEIRDQNHFETKIHVEEKITTLEEVVEKVVDILSERNSHSSSFNDLKIIENLRATGEVLGDVNKDNGGLIGEKQDLGENNDTGTTLEEKDSTSSSPVLEPASPSYSSSSHVTRWEALADIAAELPPSLAVDRLTGEIFTLTK